MPVKKIVIKIGASVLRRGGGLDLHKFQEIAEDVSALLMQNKKIIMVSSGAIASAMARLGYEKRPTSIPKLQALAAIGQIELMKLYQRYFSSYKVEIAQVLLTWDDFSDRKRYLNAKATLEELLNLKVVPIINENDAVGIEEIKLGDNDRLSAMVASMVGADLLLMLSDVDGIYDQNGNLIEEIDDIKRVKRFCFDTDKEFCVGGMITKLEAAEIAVALGIPCRISNGKQENPIINALDKGAGTFIKAERRLKARKHWLAYLSRSKGKIVIDSGAEEAVMRKGKSILPKGIVKVEGNFGVGDLIDVLNEKGKCIARGIANYSSSEVDKIKGKSTSEIEEVLGFKRRDEVIYRDNLVILKEEVYDGI